MKRICLIAVVLAVCFGMFFFSGCQEKKKETIKIGAILPLTGSVSVTGQENKAGIEYALEKINKDKKLIEVVYEDGKGDAKTSVTAIKKLEMQGIDKFFLSTTQTVIPILSMYQNNDKFFFSVICQTKGVLDNTNNAMRLYFSTENETAMMVNYITDNKMVKVATFSINIESCIEPVNDIKKQLVQTNADFNFLDMTFEFSDKDFKGKFTRIKEFNPDVLIIYSYPNQWENIVRQLTEQGMNYPIVANSGFGLTAEKDYYKNLEVMKHIVFPAPRFVIDKEKPEVKKIIKDLKEKYNVDANYNVLYPYDNMIVIAQNLQYVNDNRKFLDEIGNKEYDGVTGKISFNSKRDIKLSELFMVQIVEGQYKIIQ
jgi:branched-chain amino acid transport system substrate-binding protein